MPASHFAGPPQRSIAVPDYEDAIAKVDRLGFPLGDRRRTVAIAVIRRGKTPLSVRSMAWTVVRTLGWFNRRGIDVLDATLDDCREWWNSLARYAPATRDHYLQCLRLFYFEAKEREYIPRDPSRLIEYERQDPLVSTPALTKAQAKTLVRVIDEELEDQARHVVAVRDAALVGVLMRLCLRETEARELVWSNIGMDQGVTVLSFVGKGRKGATMLIPPDVLARLEALRDLVEEKVGRSLHGADAIFTAMNAQSLRQSRRRGKQPIRPLARAEIFRIIRDRLAQIGAVGARMGPHCLRATGATLAYEGGADLVACQKLLRHASIETTRKFYIKRTESKAMEAMDCMGLDE